MEWQKKLFEHEVVPPPGNWEEIRQKLEPGFISIQETLSEASVTPPAPGWDFILRKLEQEEPDHFRARGKLINIRPLRLVVAAALTIFVFSALYLLVLKPRLVKPTDIVTSLLDTQKSQMNQPGSEQRDSNQYPANPSDSQAETVITDTKTGLGRTTAGPVAESIPHKEVRYELQSLKNYPRLIARNEGRIQLAPHRLPYPATAEKLNPQNVHSGYILIPGREGNTIRISAKFRDVIAYLNYDSAEPDPSEINVSERNYWQAVFSSWRKKLQFANLVPDSENFFDIVEFTRLLEENQ